MALSHRRFAIGGYQDAIVLDFTTLPPDVDDATASEPFNAEAANLLHGIVSRFRDALIAADRRLGEAG